MFFKRVLLALKGMVAGGDAAEVCERNGMHSFVDELRPVGARLQRLFTHNVKVKMCLFFFLSPARGILKINLTYLCIRRESLFAVLG